MIPETTTVVVRHWGVCNDNGHAPHNLEQFMYALQDAMAEVPGEYQSSAEIDFDPDYEFGETYAAVRVTYERPMTESERNDYIAEERKRIEEAIARNERWNDEKRRELAKLAA